jgi:hypothetical protein
MTTRLCSLFMREPLGSPPGTRVCNALKSLKVVPVTADVNNHMGE